METLIEGKKYDISALIFMGWTVDEGTEGYNCWDYFEDDGEYRGPDMYGVEPIFETAIY